MDGRRHSVDVPISKTLLALRRVRSLRDPSTNSTVSTSKFSALVDDLNWDTNSMNAITLGFNANCLQEVGNGVKNYLNSKNFGFNNQGEDKISDPELLNVPRKSYSKLDPHENSLWVGKTGSVPIGTKQTVNSNHCGTYQEGVCGNKSISERYCNDYMDKGLDLKCITAPSDCLEGVGSCNELIEGSMEAERVDQNAPKWKNRYRKQIRSSRAATGDILSHVGSPCLSVSDAPVGMSVGTSLFGNEDDDMVDCSYRGCGISSCWSGTPRSREPNLPSDVEDQPLLSGELVDALPPGKGDSWKCMNNEIATYSDSPRSLSQKFRPKSFHELVGQNVVAMSLLTAISNEMTTSFYLFHGPRGTGKTSASRIFAAALNCLSLEDTRPCGLCRECILFFSGRSKSVQEVDSMRINRRDSVRSLIKNVSTLVSSQFKVFIVDECHLLRTETWITVLNILGECSPHVVFIMITPHIDKLPRSAVSQSKRYFFPKIREVDIGDHLGKICTEEGLEFDQGALDFIATKSNGSLRDAEMMLEQLSLLGKRITMPLVYELIGIVPDDELLDLLDLALSSDTSSTVRKARELMTSRVHPMQLISQLANLIMDILAGKYQDGSSEVRKKFFTRHMSEARLQQLNRALKILSETEKQLRTSKSQTTWLTVALLQLSCAGSSSLDANDLKLCERTVQLRDGNFCSTSSSNESLKHLVSCACLSNESHKVGMKSGNETLESIWKKSIAACKSNSLRSFLRKRGKLASISFNQGMAVVELEFHRPAYVTKAEKSWKLIANSIQSILGCNVEVRINLVHYASVTKNAKFKKPTFSLFSCSRKMRHESESATEQGSAPSDNSDVASGKITIRDKYVETCSSNCGSQSSHNCCRIKEVASSIRNKEGNALSTGAMISCGSLPDHIPEFSLGVDSSRAEIVNQECLAVSAQEAEKHIGCFSISLKLHRKMSSTTTQNPCLSFQPQDNLALSIAQPNSAISCSCADDHQINYSNDENGLKKEPKMHCWSNPKFLFGKAWQPLDQPGRAHMVKWVLPCTTAK